MSKIFVNGSFDLLHTGHLDLLFYAKSLGDYLHVALDSDERIKKLKGSDRPVNPIYIRKAIMEALKPVNSVSVFDTDEDLINSIKIFSPDIIVKGSDWRDKKIIGKEHCAKIIFYERINKDSTTRTIEEFIYRNKHRLIY
jgi:rfaE bifunctional protein nucleotidyltransferase chain/domain